MHLESQDCSTRWSTLQVLKCRLPQVSGHWGPWSCLHILFRASKMKVGILVGEDKCGNKDCEDNSSVLAVTDGLYTEYYWNGWQKHILWCGWKPGTPERHGWPHCVTDGPRTAKPPTAHKFIWTSHKFNMNGTQSNRYLIPPLERSRVGPTINTLQIKTMKNNLSM